MPNDLGNKIRQARLAKHLTQEDLAKKVGTTKQNIYKYETGIITNIPLDRLEAIADVLSVTPSDLTGWYGPSIHAHVSDPSFAGAASLVQFPAGEDPRTAVEHRLLRAWRAATDQAQAFALQLLESNPKDQESEQHT